MATQAHITIRPFGRVFPSPVVPDVATAGVADPSGTRDNIPNPADTHIAPNPAVAGLHSITSTISAANSQVNWPRDPCDVLITELLEDYIRERGEKVIAGDRIRYAMMPLICFWKEQTVAVVTRQTCEAYCQWRQRSDGTVRRELGVLRASINHAHAEGRLSRTPMVHLPDPPGPRERWLTKSEAASLLRASLRSSRARRYLPLFIVIGLHTGARKTAISSLRWDQVDLQFGLIDWQPVGRKRTKKRRPRIRIPRKLLGHLRRARLRAPDSDFVIHDNGSPVNDPKKGFAAACKRAHIEKVSPHVLRHTRATWGMQAGAKTWELSGFLGMTEQTLIEIYGHHHPDYQRHAAETY